MDYEYLTDYKVLYQHLKSRLTSGKMTYIFLDEVHPISMTSPMSSTACVSKKYRFIWTGAGRPVEKGVLYTEYLQNSSFPYALTLKDDPNAIRAYLERICNTIVVKDIVNRKRVTDVMMLKSLLRFAFSSIGSPLSSKKIADTMPSDGRKIDTKTVENI